MRKLKVAVVGFVSASLLGCGEPPNPSTPYAGPPLASEALVLLNNLQVSGLGRINKDGTMHEVPDIALGADPVLAMSKDTYLAVVRDRNLIYEVDPFTLALQHEFVTYEDAELESSKLLDCQLLVKGINPQDVAIDSAGRRWVTRFEQSSLAVVAQDGKSLEKVDLSAYADADGLPEASAVHIVGERAFVTVEQLDRCGGFKPTGPGLILEIDIATRQVEKSIVLGGANPFGRLVPAPWDLSGNTVAIALSGDFLSINGGDAAALVDLQSGIAKGFGREQDLDGSITELALATPNEAYVIVSNPELAQVNATSVVRIDATTGSVGPVLLDSRTESNPDGGFCHRGLTVVGEHVLVGSQVPCEIGVIVLDRQSGQQVGVIHPENLPPIAIQAVP